MNLHYVWEPGRNVDIWRYCKPIQFNFSIQFYIQWRVFMFNGNILKISLCSISAHGNYSRFKVSEILWHWTLTLDINSEAWKCLMRTSFSGMLSCWEFMSLHNKERPALTYYSQLNLIRLDVEYNTWVNLLPMTETFFPQLYVSFKIKQ